MAGYGKAGLESAAQLLGNAFFDYGSLGAEALSSPSLFARGFGNKDAAEEFARLKEQRRSSLPTIGASEGTEEIQKALLEQISGVAKEQYGKFQEWAPEGSYALEQYFSDPRVQHTLGALELGAPSAGRAVKAFNERPNIDLTPSATGTPGSQKGMAKLVDGKKVGQKGDALTSLWDDIDDPDIATEMANKGAHLKRDKTGQYIGAPRGIDTPQKLAALRKRIDEKVSAGAYGMDWYDRARKTFTRYAPDDPNKQKLMSRATAAYSPSSSPDNEMGAFAKHHNSQVLTGESIRPGTDAKFKNVERAYKDDGTYDPEAIELGEKTGPYSDARDPTIDEDDLYKTANDIWHGRVMGYGDDFDRGFTKQEHAFLTGENLLLAKRAAAADKAAGIDHGTQWTPRAGQAATWTEQRRRDYIKKAIASHEKKNAKLKTPKPLDMDDIIAKATAYAQKGMDDAAERHSAHITREARTGADVNHMWMDDPDLIESYTADSLAESPRDQIMDALGLYSTDNRPTRGKFVTASGNVEENPGWVNDVLVSTDHRKGETPITMPADRAALDYSTLIDAFIRAQQGGGHSRFFPQGMGSQRVSEQNAVNVANIKNPDELARVTAEKGYDVYDWGDQKLVSKPTDYAPTPGSTGEILKALAGSDLDADVRKGLTESGWHPTLLNEAPEGSGIATQNLLDQSAKFSQQIPDLEARTADAVGDTAGSMNRLDARYAEENPDLIQRNDIVKVREIMDGFEGMRGIQALRAYVAKHGSKGLPVVALALLEQEEQNEIQ